MTATLPDLYMPPRLLAPGGTPADLTTHEQRYGPLSYGDPAALLRTVAAAGLTGRGGAAFPVHRKLAAVAESGRRTGRTPVVVANGAEGEPASRKDKTLLALSPHLVLDGIQVAARAVGAAQAYLAVEEGASYLESALAALPTDRCGLAETARVLRYLALQSAGQCGPCLNGLPRIATAFRTLATPGPQGTTRTDVARWSGLVEGRGACHHPDGTVRLVRSALTTFASELDAHARGLCTATDRTPLLPVPQEA
ncbi:hypothetical protein GCM10022403_061430 [Streptomyces coacervatus]|uniref:Oxidoreductase n=1 Tax=Streptomyces coacervatus TaxID=647381 RepID=A0ABP7IJ97_9ACTN|nr:NADH-ubiquinone oxidoreductase-F iron-sulfur binding region domain-containing protein [Streptomyces coacervatus]MDF2269944.1 NADH-ubiquinone oxidoreductase-F iron-sulfur binding region domain-containing protein [Streptomyces coacervatus]